MEQKFKIKELIIAFKTSCTQKFIKYRYGLTFFSYIIISFFTGLVCVLFMKAFSFFDSHRFDFKSYGFYAFIISPALFIISVNIIHLFSPFSQGSGIPQVMFAIIHPEHKKAKDMVSFKTMVVKFISILIAVWAGASAGREGPTVQIGACFFVFSLYVFSILLPVNFDIPTAAITGGAAGFAAAFNTPLAGVTFAIEELGGKYFENIKDYAIMGIIISAISAQLIMGDYVYFGKLRFESTLDLKDVIFVAIISSIFGGIFAKVLLIGTELISKISSIKRYIIIPAISAMFIIILGQFAGSDIHGAGNNAASEFLKGNITDNILLFAISKMLATTLTYITGIAAGIFAPSLSMGASFGASIASFMEYSISISAAVGMASFLTAITQAPITSFVIVFEMTGNHHHMLLPVMFASMTSYIIMKSFKAKPLYYILMERYLKD